MARTHTPALVAAACALAVAACGTPANSESSRRFEQAPQPQAPPRVSAQRLESSIQTLINRERAAQGLKPLAWDDALAAIARGHSEDMGRRDYFKHESPEGEGFDTRYRNGQYRCALRVGNVIYKGGENIALEYLYASITTIGERKYYNWLPEDELARRAVAGWMASPGHRANILKMHWAHEGIGVAITRDHKVYLTQNFC